MRSLKMGPALFVLLFATTAVDAAPFDVSSRQTIDLPPNVVQALRGEMVELLGNLQRVQSLSAEGKFIEAADLVDKTMGSNAMSNFTAAIRPDMFMPPAMRTLAQDLHRSASEWAVALRSFDRRQADSALANVIGSCSACHQGFQLRRTP